MKAKLLLTLATTTNLVVGQENQTPSPPALESARLALADHLPAVAISKLTPLLNDPNLTQEQINEIRLQLAEAQIRNGQTQEALTTLKPLPPGNTNDYWTGLALLLDGKFDSALDTLSRINDGKLLPNALVNRIEILSLLGRTREALPLIAQLRKDFPDFRKQPLVLLEANYYLNSREPEEALALLATLKKNTPRTRLLRTRALLETGKAEEALEQLAPLLGSTTLPNPVLILASLEKTEALLALGKPSEAVDTLLPPPVPNPSPSNSSAILKTWKTLYATDAKAKLLNKLSDYLQLDSLGEDANPAFPIKLEALLLLAQGTTETSPEEGLNLLDQLIRLAPESPQSAKARFHAAELQLARGNREQAISLLQAVVSCGIPNLAAQASDQLARLKAADEHWQEAAQLFAKSAKSPSASFSRTALLNQALAELAAGDDSLLQSLPFEPDSNLKLSLELERILLRARKGEQDAADSLDQFLSNHPNHPRADEARLSLAELVLSGNQPTTTFVRALLDSLENVSPPFDYELQVFLLERKLAELTGSWTKAVEKGNQILRTFPTASDDIPFLLKLGEACFQAKDFSRARFLFGEVVESEKSGSLADLANLFAARCDLSIPTQESSDSAMAILDKLIREGGPLATEARFLKANTQFQSLGRAKEAIATLSTLPGKLEDYPEAALLAAEAYRELGPSDSSNYQKAARIYETLLNDPAISYPFSNRIHFLLARVYRESGQPAKAIEVLYRVVLFENLPAGEPVPEWNYYYECGFEALEILEEAKRFRAAHSLALKLAATDGPGAEKAKARAEQIQLDNLVWE